MSAVYLASASADIESRLRHLESLAEGLSLRWVDSALPVEDIAAQCGDTPAIVIGGRYGQMSELARRLPALRLVQTFTAGTDWLDVAALDQLGVQVSDNNGANANPVAEHTIALMLAVYHKLDQQFTSVKAGSWQEGIRGPRSEMHTLVGKRVGLVGLGRIGSRVARRLQGWECKLLFCDTAEFDAEYLRPCNAQRLSFDELLSTCDVVSLHVPLNRLTHHLVSTRELALMQTSSLLINTCRGPVVDEQALIEALQKGQLLGAGLDVTDSEPIEQDNPLLHLPNVLITPHFAAQAHDPDNKGAHHAAENLARSLRGEAPRSIVAPV